MKRLDRLLEYYNFLFYLLCFGGIAVSISYTFRLVRGSYAGFTLSDSNALFFFLGALLIALALFSAILRALGPVAYSASELFWRYTAVARLPKNPWAASSLWASLALLGLLVVLLATIFAPLSPLWLAGASIGSLLFAVLLVHWAQAEQLKPRSISMRAWALTTALAGILLTIYSTRAPMPQIRGIDTAVLVGATLAIAALMLTLNSLIKTAKTPLCWEAATHANARRAVVLQALSSAGSPDSYKFYGTGNRWLQKRFRTCQPALISLLATLDSLLVVVAIFALSLPVGIFLGTAYQAFGVGVVTVIGCWVVSVLFRWQAREWTAQPALRSWIGAPTLGTLLGFCAGPALASALYAAAMGAVFELPWHMPLVALIFGVHVAMGELNPPTHFNYDLVFTTPDGILVPLAWVVKNLMQILLVCLAVFWGPYTALTLVTIMVGKQMLAHALGEKPLTYLWEKTSLAKMF